MLFLVINVPIKMLVTYMAKKLDLCLIYKSIWTHFPRVVTSAE